MWFLWIFGCNVEDICGPVRYLCFYLLCGLLSTYAYVAGNPHSEVPLVGASGAISGVLGAYLLRFPRAYVRTLLSLGIFMADRRFPGLRLPAHLDRPANRLAIPFASR